MTRGETNTRESLLLRLPDGGPDECWSWDEAVNQGGYGRARYGSKVYLAHRLFYEFLVGPIPDGMELDHTCHNADPTCVLRTECPHRRCVNPAHLEPVTKQENLSRKRVSGPPRDAITHCVNGHAFTAENTYRTSRGYRLCRICRRATKKRYKDKTDVCP